MKGIDCTRTILRAIQSPKMKKDDIAAIYTLIIARPTQSSIPTINKAIIKRWTCSGLQDIKRMAWRAITG